MKLTTDVVMDTYRQDKNDKSIQTEDNMDRLDFKLPGLDYMGQKRRSDTLEIPQPNTPDVPDFRRSSGARRGSLWSLASGSSGRGSGASGKSLILPAITLPPPPEYLELKDRKVKHYTQ